MARRWRIKEDMATCSPCSCLARLCECARGILSAPQEAQVSGCFVAAQQQTCDEQTAAVLRTIRAAQDDGLSRSCPGFAVARSEIQAGAKRSHWIWYVWPSLHSVRSNVKYPQFLLPNLQVARAYLHDPVLADRLVDMSQLATAHLYGGVDAKALFGKQHKYDVAKFREAMTFFAVAARLNQDARQEGIFLVALRALGAEDLDEHTLHVLRQSADVAEASAADAVSASFHLLEKTQP